MVLWWYFLGVVHFSSAHSSIQLCLDRKKGTRNLLPNDPFQAAQNLNSMSSQASSYASVFWTERDREFKINTRHYGDLESLRVNVTYVLSALAVSVACFVIFTKILGKRTIKAGYNAISAISFAVLLTSTFNLLRPATRLPLAQLKNSEILLNSCVNSIKGGKNFKSFRDCYFGEDGTCSLKNPCTPCNPTAGLDANVMFDIVQSIFKGQQCRKCTSLNQACPGKNQEGKNYCKRQAYSPQVSAIERTINGSVAQHVAGWEVVHVEPCTTCCVTNRTMEFLRIENLVDIMGL